MKRDFTIYTDAPIARDGGVVIILPTPVPQPEGFDLAEDAATTREITISSQVSVVRLYHPVETGYVYRFRSANEEAFPSTSLQTARIGAGSRWDTNPETGELEEFETVLTHHIETPSGTWTMSETSDAIGTRLRLGGLETRYPCQKAEDALICDLSAGPVE